MVTVPFQEMGSVNNVLADVYVETESDDVWVLVTRTSATMALSVLRIWSLFTNNYLTYISKQMVLRLLIWNNFYARLVKLAHT